MKKNNDYQKLDNKLSNQLIHIWLWGLIGINVLFITVIYLGNHTKIKNFLKYDLWSYFLKEKQLEEEEITSYHEAGHTLIALLYPENFQVPYVTIKRTQRTLGHTSCKVLKSDPKTETLVNFGGTAAENILAKNHQMKRLQVGKGSGFDHNSAKHNLNKFSPYPQKDFNAFLQKTEHLLQNNKDALDEIARKLLITKTLSQKDLDEITKKYPLKKSYNK
ncbi:hypothetical protein ['Santalum album' aster yellows phytoplasma]|uniref:Peptidase M41 domain-containing protein n=1 Tax='Santalum album' aster yellows phytoplasma TaxID=2831467 RepID=A0ABS5LKT6_9MOLU|nr:hypothetical protein ['Santalum album' aster yellows phytoplasma]MBS2994013.1 hypothetical protein ['Santalum album' aster yellows phytoplasma]